MNRNSKQIKIGLLVTIGKNEYFTPFCMQLNLDIEPSCPGASHTFKENIFIE